MGTLRHRGVRWTVLGPLFMAIGAGAQTYTHPTLGVQNTYSGTCLVSTCSGTYYDDGGAGGNYSPNVNAIYRTFCPNTAGMCMRATFTAFDMNDVFILCGGPGGCCDYLQVLNGPAQNSPAVYSNCVASPGTITATNASGCLTFRFVSDNTIELGGWAATLSCVPCAGGPSGTSNADCGFATPVCTDQAIADASVGPGITAEGCSGCNTSEVFTNWYRIQIQASGTLAFTINPNNNADDFDPVVYGPNASCGSLGVPVRCSYAIGAGNGNTGLGNGAVDPSEDVFGDQWVSTLNVVAGETYYVLINGWSATSGANGFLMDWTGTASLNCVILPVEMTSFMALCEEGLPRLQWTTASEHNSSRFVVQRSANGSTWQDLGTVSAAGNSTEMLTYQYVDLHPLLNSMAYYRLRQVDVDGVEEFSQVTALNDCAHRAAVLSAYPQPADNTLQVVFDAGCDSNAPALFELRDALGRMISRQPASLVGGRASLAMDIANIPSGTYVLGVRTDGSENALHTRVVKR